MKYVSNIDVCYPEYINLSMLGLMGESDYLKKFLPETYEEQDEAIVKHLIHQFRLNQKYTGDILLLFLSYRNVLKISFLAFNHEREQEELEATLKKIKVLLSESEFPLSKKILQNSLSEIESHLLTSSDKAITKPKQIEAELIRGCAPLAQFLWFTNLIPGKGEISSKDSVYRFIFDFVKACGFDLPRGYTPNHVKDHLKKSLQSIDQHKIHPKYEEL